MQLCWTMQDQVRNVMDERKRIESLKYNGEALNETVVRTTL